MGDKTKIEWTDASWNPIVGCTKVSPGCDNCYAERITNRFAPGTFDTVTLRPERLDQPRRWRRPRRVFVNSMSDLFHDQIPDEYIAKVFAVMALSPVHTFQVLTKRHSRMRSLLHNQQWLAEVAANVDDLGGDPEGFSHPLPNVWLGVSVENQKWADIRVPALLDTPAAVRFLSCEPLLGPVTLPVCETCNGSGDYPEELLPEGESHGGDCPDCNGSGNLGIDWVIVGGESGPHARPMHPDWARSLRDQCVNAHVAFHFKQHGEWAEDVRIDADGDRHLNVPPDGNRDRNRCAMHPAGMTAMTPDNRFNPFAAGHPHWTAMRRVGKKTAGRELDGRTWDEHPEAIT